ncbi:MULTISPECIES: DUF6088 family protein [Sphingobacterium]|uniref:Type IV toxin-antitoxin system AbiEi family antitoxin domain-containing protein n=2 Tax=Sphingobacterium multivorum TaxID=28454 RepID=A0A654CNJ4_SPHMU|nr:MULTISPECIES: DUF6088 family protein [Sphingobacterium]OJZ11027.1 MAG: hypothetical protein BGP15_01465 [Sphingobacterium sp. 40-24]QQT44632.1 hypothetical protein I6J00_23440 [Sphingobacterium multivorum]SUJ87892.1 Uncharacterised protein [Sphingobacterium multivorum]VXC95025.1 conserved hypothetical protein [Sphingobacterium multivorum]
MESVDNKIIVKIKKAKRGSLFFIEDFLNLGTSKAVSKALERLVEKEELSRVSRGIYSRLRIDPVLGAIYPTTEEIAEAVRRRDKARIVPTGILALNALGLSTQVPMNLVYLTDGAARTIQIGKRKIVFKKTSPRNLAAIGSISSLAIQALREIGKDKVTEDEINSILRQLEKEDPYRLQHDIKLAPEWIRIIMRQALKTNRND